VLYLSVLSSHIKSDSTWTNFIKVMINTINTEPLKEWEDYWTLKTAGIVRECLLIASTGCLEYCLFSMIDIKHVSNKYFLIRFVFFFTNTNTHTLFSKWN
jgi:hypothetical protein